MPGTSRQDTHPLLHGLLAIPISACLCEESEKGDREQVLKIIRTTGDWQDQGSSQRGRKTEQSVVEYRYRRKGASKRQG